MNKTNIKEYVLCRDMSSLLVCLLTRTVLHSIDVTPSQSRLLLRNLIHLFLTVCLTMYTVSSLLISHQVKSRLSGGRCFMGGVFGRGCQSQPGESSITATWLELIASWRVTLVMACVVCERSIDVKKDIWFIKDLRCSSVESLEMSPNKGRFFLFSYHVMIHDKWHSQYYLFAISSVYFGYITFFMLHNL